MFQPLFRMHVGLLDFNVKRTRKYLGHGGAYIPECIMPWGDHFPYVYGVKYEWKDRPDKLQDGGWHKYEWVGQLEVSLMLLDYHAYTQDDAWFTQKALPAIREYVRFFDEHYKLDAKGRYNMNPAQALETWWDCTNPMPEVAGLTRVTERLLALPKDVLPDADRALFEKIRARIPDLPTRTLGGQRAGRPTESVVAYAPAERCAKKSNVEHPELYCVFPFRLCSFEKPNAALGRAAYNARTDRHYQGWKQEELFAAYLGMADEAAEHLARRRSIWRTAFSTTPQEDSAGPRTGDRTSTGVPTSAPAATSRTFSSPCSCSTRATRYSSCPRGRRTGTATSNSTRRRTPPWRGAWRTAS